MLLSERKLRRLLAVLVLLGTLSPIWSAGKQTGQEAKSEDAEMKLFAQGEWPFIPVHAAAATPQGRHFLVLRSAEELAKAAGSHALPSVTKALKVPRIDFPKQMVVVVADYSQPMVGVSGGAAPSALFRTEIANVIQDEAGKVLQICGDLPPATLPRQSSVPRWLLPSFPGSMAR